MASLSEAPLPLDAMAALVPDGAICPRVLPCQNKSFPAETAQSGPSEFPPAQGRISGVRSSVQAL